MWYSGDGRIPKPLYVNSVFRQHDQVGVVLGFEGEAKADCADDLDIAAFSFKDITQEQAAQLAGCDVVLWPDNDASGDEQARTAVRVISNSERARSIKLLQPPAEFPPARRHHRCRHGSELESNDSHGISRNRNTQRSRWQ